MNNTLEFRQFVQEYLTVKIPNPLNNEDLEIIEVKLNKPTERVNIMITNTTIKQLEIQKKINENEVIKQDEQLQFLEQLEDLVLALLSNNRQGLKFDYNYVQTYFSDVENMSVLIAGMTEFMQKIKSSKN